MNVDRHQLRETIRNRALDLGFSRIGFTDAEPLEPALQRRWARWFAENKAGEMTWLLRPEPRRTHPRDLLPNARSAIVVAAAYYDGDHPEAPVGAGKTGKIARYAWGRDYHLVMKENLAQLAEEIAALARENGIEENIESLACVDSKPIDERSLAVRAGLGFIGKSTLLIDPEGGSWMLLGVLLTSLELPPDEKIKKLPSCGSCRHCIEACPTAALSPYSMDPRRCISYLTIELRAAIPEELKSKMQEWAFGCDICQEVCPFNDKPLTRAFPGLAATEGAGAWVSETVLDETPGAKSFVRRWGHTPLARTGLKSLKRNLRSSDDD